MSFKDSCVEILVPRLSCFGEMVEFLGGGIHLTWGCPWRRYLDPDPSFLSLLPGCHVENRSSHQHIPAIFTVLPQIQSCWGPQFINCI